MITRKHYRIATCTGNQNVAKALAEVPAGEKDGVFWELHSVVPFGVEMAVANPLAAKPHQIAVPVFMVIFETDVEVIESDA